MKAGLLVGLVVALLFVGYVAYRHRHPSFVDRCYAEPGHYILFGDPERAAECRDIKTERVLFTETRDD